METVTNKLKERNKANSVDVKELQSSDSSLIVISDDTVLIDLDQYNIKPKSHKQKFETGSLSSFCDYVNNNIQEGIVPVMYTDKKRLGATCYLNQSTVDNPTRNNNMAILDASVSDEFKKVKDDEKKHFSQKEFLDFIVDHRHFTSFSKGDKTFSIHEAMDAISSLTVTSIETINSKVSDFSAKKTSMEAIDIVSEVIETPNKITFLTIPVEGLEEIEITADLRLRVDSDDNVNVFFRLREKSRINQEIMGACKSFISSRTDVGVFYEGHI